MSASRLVRAVRLLYVGGVVGLTALVGALAVAVAVGAVGILTATSVGVADHPTYVRAVVDFTDGTLRSYDVVAADAQPLDGTASVLVSHGGIETQANAVSAHGISVRVVHAVDQIRIELRAGQRRFKYLSYEVLGANRLAIELWKNPPPTNAAGMRTGSNRCLAVEQVRVSAGVVHASGHEHNLFEHQFQVLVRLRDGSVLAHRSVTAAAGQWSTQVRYHLAARQSATVEAADAAAKDGSLACLAQTIVTLPAAH